MITFAVVSISPMVFGQEAKIHLRDFTPKYKIDTFQIQGNPHVIKNRVIKAQDINGVKSSFWDDASNTLTVQYNNRLIPLDQIKDFFNGNPVSQKLMLNKQELKFALVPCCSPSMYSFNFKNK